MLNQPNWWDVITRQFNFAFSLFFNYSVGLVLPQQYKVWHLYILIVILKRCKALRLFQDTSHNLKLLLKMANPIYKQIFQIRLKLQQLPHFKSRLPQVKKKKCKTDFCSHSKFLLFQFTTLLRLGLGSYKIEQNSYMFIKPISSFWASHFPSSRLGHVCSFPSWKASGMDRQQSQQ